MEDMNDYLGRCDICGAFEMEETLVEIVSGTLACEECLVEHKRMIGIS